MVVEKGNWILYFNLVRFYYLFRLEGIVMKIVESGYKLDLHIHSCYSSSKGNLWLKHQKTGRVKITISKIEILV